MSALVPTEVAINFLALSFILSAVVFVPLLAFQTVGIAPTEFLPKGLDIR